MRVLSVLAVLALAGCVSTVEPPVQERPVVVVQPAEGPVTRLGFSSVRARVEPVAERVCRDRTQGVSCDYLIQIDSRAGQPSNAYQTLDSSGRPVITFTSALLQEAQNDDELAFIMGHEAAHHIRGHIPKQQQTALAGALLLGTLAAIGGAGDGVVRTAQDIGAGVGARAFSKEMELEADKLGTVIASRAGYDPVRGAAFFARIPDPGDRFLGSHPPNAQRQEAVRRTASGL